MRRGEGVVRVSLDETCVSLLHTGAKGTIMRCWPGSQERIEAWAKASRQQLRSSFTHVAMICDDTSLQPLLPQLLVCGQSTLSKADHLFLAGRLPENIILVRQKKGWMTQELMVQLVKLLHQSVREKLGKRRLIVSLDCAKKPPPRAGRACYGVCWDVVHSRSGKADVALATLRHPPLRCLQKPPTPEPAKWCCH